MNEIAVMPVSAAVKTKGRASRIVTAVLLAPFAVTSALAQSTTDPAITKMAGDSQAGVDAVKTGVVGLLGVVVVIGLLVWGARHLRPKGG